MAMMYPMNGLSCNGVMCPFETPLVRGASGLQGTNVLGPPLGMRTDLLPRCPLAAEPLATGVMSNEVEKREPERKEKYCQVSSQLWTLIQS